MVQSFSSSRAHPLSGVQCDSVGAHMTQGNRYTYTIFIDKDLILVTGGHKIFSPGMGGFAKDN